MIKRTMPKQKQRTPSPLAPKQEEFYDDEEETVESSEDAEFNLIIERSTEEQKQTLTFQFNEEDIFLQLKESIKDFYEGGDLMFEYFDDVYFFKRDIIISIQLFRHE